MVSLLEYKFGENPELYYVSIQFNLKTRMKLMILVFNIESQYNLT